MKENTANSFEIAARRVVQSANKRETTDASFELDLMKQKVEKKGGSTSTVLPRGCDPRESPPYTFGRVSPVPYCVGCHWDILIAHLVAQGLEARYMGVNAAAVQFC